LIPSPPAPTTEKPLAEVLVEGELSPFEDEKIYRILREKFKVQHPTYSHSDNEELATRVNIVFHQPYSISFFNDLLQHGWQELKALLTDIKHRRGHAGAAYTLTFRDHHSRITFVSGVLDDGEFRSSVDQISYLTWIIAQMLRPETMEKPLETVETSFDRRSQRWDWFRGFTELNEQYVFDGAKFRWVRQ